MQGLHDNNLHRVSHRPMTICLLHESRIVDEEHNTDWAIREEAQIPFLTFTFLHEEEP